ncbi:MAG: exodeoxyribonuclease VII large subunit [Anaerolineae bacterium]|jgi:exodeoxyribonuclease VII large subunit
MQVYSVSQVTLRVKGLLDSDAELADLWIAGQVSNPRRAPSGHWYFTILDEASELRCVMWRGLASRAGQLPEQGQMIEAHGYISVYERGGTYQFYVDTIEAAGTGLLWEQFARLRARLQAEGLFDEARKRPLPERPARIGIVTSPTGAALQDMLRVLRERYPLVEVWISPTLVQGTLAPPQIVSALERLYALPALDLIIVARGGGSLEDLWCFNDESVARAIAASNVPVVTGVGHETDLTIADMVADLRAPTPTAAATVVVPDAHALRENLLARRAALLAAMGRTLQERRLRLQHVEHILQGYHPRRQLGEMRQRLDDRLERMTRAARQGLQLRRAPLQVRLGRLEALDARRVLDRGYALVRIGRTGRGLTSVGQVAPGDALQIDLRDGRVDAAVTETHVGGPARGRTREDGTTDGDTRSARTEL